MFDESLTDFDLINDTNNFLIFSFRGRHNQLPHDRKDSNNMRHADRNLAQNEVSRTHNNAYTINLRLNSSHDENGKHQSNGFFFLLVSC